MDFCVYEQYFAACHPGNGRPRRAVRAALTVSTGAGRVRYEAELSFFPHDAEDDFAVSWDVCSRRVLSEAPGRRSGKREAALLEELRPVLDRLASESGGEIFWDRPLIPERRG